MRSRLLEDARDGTPWLPVRADAGWVLVGPAVHPSRPGCPACVQRRRDGNLPDAAARRALGRDDSGGEPLPVVSALVAALVREEAESGFARTAGALLRVSASTGAVTRHRVLPDPLCPDCAAPAEERPKRLTAAAAPKPDPARFRTRVLDDALEELYVDAETGLIGSVGVGAAGEVPWAVARLAPGRTGDDGRHGYGRARDVRSARLSAITEALERYSGVRSRGRRPVRAAYSDVAGHALDPRTLGLYPDDWYDRPGFRYTRFDPDTETSWVWGYSFGTSRPLLVPESCAYYGSAEPAWAYECSNGAALGGSLTEAILYGLLEVAERDAFLLTWYGRLPAPKVDLDSVADHWIPLAATRLRQTSGYEVMAFATLMEQRVPAFWVLALDRLGGEGRPHVLCAAGAHLDPEQALRGALLELFGSVGAPADLSAAFLDDADQVREMGHHRRLYWHPDAWPRLGFLPADGPGRPLAELAEPWPAHEDLAEDLAELAGRYLATGLDVIAVDTTCAELRAGGFACAKVIVPGAVPMTFGHRHRRTHGLPRLLSVPRLLGFRDRDLRPEELNPYPHPFP